jgi:hypothetical protein
VTTTGTLLWLPVERSQGIQVEAIGQGRQLGEDVAQVGVGIFPVALAGDDDRVDDGGACGRAADVTPTSDLAVP